MSVINENISSVRNRIFEIFAGNGITSVSRNNQFEGIILSLESSTPEQAKELASIIEENPEFGAQLLVRIIQNQRLRIHHTDMTLIESQPGHLGGVILSPNLNSNTAKRLYQTALHNPRATVKELLSIAGL